MDGWWNQKWCDNLSDWGKTWDTFDAKNSNELKPILYTLDFLIAVPRFFLLPLEGSLRAIHSWSWSLKSADEKAQAVAKKIIISPDGWKLTVKGKTYNVICKEKVDSWPWFLKKDHYYFEGRIYLIDSRSAQDGQSDKKS